MIRMVLTTFQVVVFVYLGSGSNKNVLSKKCGKLCLYVYLVRITASYDSLKPLSLSLGTGLAYTSGECL